MQDNLSPPSLSDGVLVRARRPGDADMLAELMNLPGFRWGTMRLPFSSPEEVRASIEETRSGSLHLVATSEGRLVGHAGLQRLAGRRSHVGSVGMGVHDAWVGRGIGRVLLQSLVDAADRWLGLNRLELTVYADNEPALALYRRFGFAVEGCHRCFALRDGAFVDALAMARLGGPIFPTGTGACDG